MREFLEDQYGVVIRQWATPTDDGEGELYEVVHQGRVIRADSLALLLSEVQAREPSRPALYLAASAGVLAVALAA